MPCNLHGNYIYWNYCVLKINLHLFDRIQIVNCFTLEERYYVIPTSWKFHATAPDTSCGLTNIPDFHYNFPFTLKPFLPTICPSSGDWCENPKRFYPLIPTRRRRRKNKSSFFLPFLTRLFTLFNSFATPSRPFLMLSSFRSLISVIYSRFCRRGMPESQEIFLSSSAPARPTVWYCSMEGFVLRG